MTSLGRRGREAGVDFLPPPPYRSFTVIRSGPSRRSGQGYEVTTDGTVFDPEVGEPVSLMTRSY